MYFSPLQQRAIILLLLCFTALYGWRLAEYYLIRSEPYNFAPFQQRFQQIADSLEQVEAQQKAAEQRESRPAAARRIDVNTADIIQLQQLPGVGPALAGRIVEYRRLHGPFRRAADLSRVRGIGAKSLQKLRPLILPD